MRKSSLPLLGGALLCVVGSLASTTWLGVWGMMELALFFSLPLFISLGTEKQISLVSIWKYFVAQTFSSLIIIFFLISDEGWGFFCSVIAFFGVMVKMGMYPFHGWSFHLAESLGKAQFFILGVVLKVPPLGMLSSISPLLGEEVLMLAVASGACVVGLLLCNLSLKWGLMSSSTYILSWAVTSSFLGKGK